MEYSLVMLRFFQSTSHKIFCAAFLLVLLGACSPANEKPLRIGTNVWIGYEPLYLARSLNFYKETSINLVELTSASDVIHALRSGTLDGAALTLDETLSLINDGLDIKVILVFDFSNGADALLSKSDISTIEQLKGKRVVVESSAVGALLLDSALSSVNMDVSEIELVSCTVDEHLACYQTNDAVVTFEPARSMLLAQGANLLYDSSKIPNKIVDVLIVLNQTIDSHPNSLRQLLSGYFNARQYLAENPNEAAKLMSPRLKIEPDDVLASLEGIHMPLLSENHQLLSGELSPLLRTANELSEFMFSRKLLKNSPVLQNLSDASFLPED